MVIIQLISRMFLHRNMKHKADTSIMYNLMKAKPKMLYSYTSTTILHNNTKHILRHKVSLLVNVSAVSTHIHTFTPNNLLHIWFDGAGHRRGLLVIHLEQKKRSFNTWCETNSKNLQCQNVKRDNLGSMNKRRIAQINERQRSL